MSAASNQEAMERFERARELHLKENKQAYLAIGRDNFSKMEKIFKSGGIKQEAIDYLIFYATSVKMLKLFLRYGGDIYKQGPPLCPHPITLLLNCTALLYKQAVDSIERRENVKLIEFLIEEGVDLNDVNEIGSTPFINCAGAGEKCLCKLLIEGGADPSAKRNDGTTALHLASQLESVSACRYLVEECGLDIDSESKDEILRPRTPLFLAALKGQIDVCRYLLEKGANFDGGENLQPLLGAAEVY
jgi:hypothetical protein